MAIYWRSLTSLLKSNRCLKMYLLLASFRSFLLIKDVLARAVSFLGCQTSTDTSPTSAERPCLGHRRQGMFNDIKDVVSPELLVNFDPQRRFFYYYYFFFINFTHLHDLPYRVNYMMNIHINDIKPIFHQKTGLRWVPDANKIDINNMKCTCLTPAPTPEGPTPPIFHWELGLRLLPNAKKSTQKKRNVHGRRKKLASPNAKYTNMLVSLR